MPELPGNRKRSQRVRYRERLAELAASNRPLGLLGEDPVDIEMKASEILADQKQGALAKGSNIDFRRGTLIQPPNVARAQGRHMSFSVQRNHLGSGEHLSRTISRERVSRSSAGMDQGLREREKL